MFFLHNVGRGNNVRATVKFFDATPTEYDDKVLQTPVWAPQSLGSHHFKDQAKQLEKVSIIRKNAPSKRRTSGALTKKPGVPRIIQIFGSGSKWYLRNFHTYERKNKFEKQFASFFVAINTKKELVAKAAVKKTENDLQIVMMKKIDQIAKRQQQAAQLTGGGIRLGRGNKMTVAPLQLTIDGIRVMRLPAPKDTVDSTRIVTSLEKQSLQTSKPHAQISNRRSATAVQRAKATQQSRENLSKEPASGTWSWSR